VATLSSKTVGDPRHLLGVAAEHAAAAGLQGAGLEILLRNWRRRSGELDIVAREGDVLVIAEVRIRNHADFGSAADSVDARKCQRIIRTTQQLLQQNPPLARLRVRFDVIAAENVGAASAADANVGGKPPQGTRWLTDPSGRFRLQWIRHAFSATR
jgi:putative endonuclease